jgi:hypothetical protein
MIDDDQHEFLFVWRLAQSCLDDDQHGRNGRRQRPAPRYAARSPALRPKALFIPFPLARRRKLVAAIASQMAAAPTDVAADRIFKWRAAQLGRGLCRKRVAERIIGCELRALEAAVRRQLWDITFATAPRRGDVADRTGRSDD